MLPVSLGIVKSTTPGTPVRLVAPSDTSNNLPNTADPWASKLVLAAPITTPSLTGNTGTVYIGLSGLAKDTGVDMLVQLAPGDSTAVEIGDVGNLIWIPGIFLDVDTSGDGVLAYYWQS